MKSWREYDGHKVNIQGSRNKFDNTVYTFDIETTSFLELRGEQLPPDKYLELSEEDQSESLPMSNMYIWMLGINNDIYYR